jgi:hypothetical protein
MTIGFFARATKGKQRAKFTITHIVDFDKVLCGYKPHKTMRFQWCCIGLREEYVECKKCLKKAKEI